MRRNWKKQPRTKQHPDGKPDASILRPEFHPREKDAVWFEAELE